MKNAPTTRRARWGAAAGVLGAATAFATLAGAGPAPSFFQLTSAQEDVSGNCDEAEHANDLDCGGSGTVTDGSPSTTVNDSSSTSTTEDDSTSATVGNPNGPADEIRTIDANGAGIVIVAVEGGRLRLVAATPSTGWRVEIEQGAGREVEVDFRSGTQRVQVSVEIEDGQVRERVRSRDDSTSGGPSSTEDNSGHGSDDGVDDHSDSGHDGTDDSPDAVDDDHSGSGHGGDDDRVDDHGGSGRDHPEDS